MEKIKELNRYQKGILILLVAMAVIFGILYAKATSKTGFLYMDKIFEVSEENGKYTYESTLKLDNGGNFGYTFRVLPKHEMLIEAENMDLIKWIEK